MGGGEKLAGGAGRVALHGALERLAREPEREYVELTRDRRLEIGIYRPIERDAQAPHDRDELYVIIAGHGDFCLGADKMQFEPGDVLFVPAGEPHHFENFPAGFTTWVIFLGAAQERGG